MKIYITRAIPEVGPQLLRDAGHEVVVSDKDPVNGSADGAGGVLTKPELIAELKKHNPDAVLSLLTDTINAEVFDAAPNAKIFANYAVGFNNIDVDAAKKRGIIITNTPDVLTDTVAEHTIALMLAVTSRIAEGDRYTRAGKYTGWGPMLMLGTDLKGKTLGILGAGRVGARVAEIAVRGLGMKLMYFDVARNEKIETEFGATFREMPDDVLRDADVISIHVPLLDSTHHLINDMRLATMKPSAYLVNTSRGPVIDEEALVRALKDKKIKGAGLDVFENEPALAPGLAELENVVLTPHIASATEETRGAMAVMAAQSIIDVFEGRGPAHRVV